jgi:hypothetical protein
VQRKEALMDENLPEEYRIELAKAFVNDLFAKVRLCVTGEKNSVCRVFFQGVDIY